MSAEQRSLLGQVREIERTHQHIGDCIACGDWDGAQARLNKIIKRYRSIQGQVCGITGNPILPNGGQR